MAQSLEFVALYSIWVNTVTRRVIWGVKWCDLRYNDGNGSPAKKLRQNILDFFKNVDFFMKNFQNFEKTRIFRKSYGDTMEVLWWYKGIPIVIQSVVFRIITPPPCSRRSEIITPPPCFRPKLFTKTQHLPKNFAPAARNYLRKHNICQNPGKQGGFLITGGFLINISTDRLV